MCGKLRDTGVIGESKCVEVARDWRCSIKLLLSVGKGNLAFGIKLEMLGQLGYASRMY